MRIALYIIITIGLLLTAIYKVGTREGWLTDLLSTGKDVRGLVEPDVPLGPGYRSGSSSSPAPSTSERGDELSRLLESRELYLAKLPPIDVSEKYLDSSVNLDKLAVVRGTQFPHSVLFNGCKSAVNEQFVEFNVGGKFSTLEIGFGYDDQHPGIAKSARCMLSILSEGEILWESPYVNPYESAIFEVVDVSSVFRLKLVVTRTGIKPGLWSDTNDISPVVIDPLLRK